MGIGGHHTLGGCKFSAEISNRAGEQAERLPEFPIVLSENLPV